MADLNARDKKKKKKPRNTDWFFLGKKKAEEGATLIPI